MFRFPSSIYPPTVRVLFITNPRSGRRSSVDLPGLIRKACASWSGPVETATAEAVEDLDSIVQGAVDSKVDVVFAVGGDGTVHEIARRLIGTGITLGILPVGSGNGLARHLGIPLDPKKALAGFTTLRVETIDTAVVDGIPFFGVMGVGFDAVIAERFASSTTRGLETYVRAGVQLLSSYVSEEYEIEVDGENVHRRSAFIVAIANSNQYGNEARIAPLASLQDGLLDLVIVDRPPILAAPLMMTQLFFGHLHRSNAAWMRRGRIIRVRRAGASWGHLDGDPVRLPAEFEVSVVPASLKVIIPDASKRAL